MKIIELNEVTGKHEIVELSDAKTNKIISGKEFGIQRAEDLKKLTDQAYKDDPEFAKVVDAYKASADAKRAARVYLYSTLIGLAIFIGLLFCGNVYAECDKIFAKVGAGYKFHEQKRFVINDEKYSYEKVSPYSARFEVGVECDRINFGIAHHSQWLTGAPFNKDLEYFKTEVFIDYKFEWSL